MGLNREKIVELSPVSAAGWDGELAERGESEGDACWG